MSVRALVAGVGDVFGGDDGFGVTVARVLAARPRDPSIVVRDVGVRALHLAYDLADGWLGEPTSQPRPWDLVIVVDAMSTGSPPGTLHVIEPSGSLAGDARGVDLDAVLRTARALGATIPPVRLIGCDVEDVSERLGLTPAVERAVDSAVARIESIVRAHGNTVDRDVARARSASSLGARMAKEAR